MFFLKYLSACIVLCSVFPNVKASTEFSISDSGVTCEGNFQVSSLQLDCGDYCTFGSNVEVQGSVIIESDLATNTPEVRVKVANMVEIFDGEVNICGSLSSQSGTSCPEAGSYTIDSFSFQVPGSGEQWYAQNSFWGTSLTIQAHFDFGDSQSYCTTSVKLSKNSGYQMVAGAVVMFGFAGILAGATRKRRVATIQIGAGEGTQSHFEMMKNSDGGVQV